MARCPVCGNTFDDLGYQVYLPGNPQPFDRLDCALAYPVQAPAPVLSTEMEETEERSLDAFIPPPFLRQLALPAAGAALVAATLAAAGVLWLHPGERAAEAIRDLAERALPKKEGLYAFGPSAESVPTAVESKRKPRPRATTGPATLARKHGSPPADLVSAPAPPAGTPEGPGQPPAPPLIPPPPQSGGSQPPKPQPSPAPSHPSQPAPAPPPASAPVVAPPATPPGSGVGEPSETRPGWGHGDENHDHTGPPGQDKDKGKGKDKGPP